MSVGGSGHLVEYSNCVQIGPNTTDVWNDIWHLTFLIYGVNSIQKIYDVYRRNFDSLIIANCLWFPFFYWGGDERVQWYFSFLVSPNMVIVTLRLAESHKQERDTMWRQVEDYIWWQGQGWFSRDREAINPTFSLGCFSSSQAGTSVNIRLLLDAGHCSLPSWLSFFLFLVALLLIAFTLL